MKLSTIKNSIKWYFFENFAIPKVKNEIISKAFFKKFLPKNPVIVDCGAYDGSDSLKLATTLKGKVHCIEAVPTLYNKLVHNTQKDSNITCYNLALGDQNGFQKFYVSDGESDASGSLLKPKQHLIDHPATVFEKTIEVQTLTLDDWAEKYKIHKVDMLWLDMQGYEYNMIKASKKIINGVSVIHTEVSTKETYESVIQFEEYSQLMIDKGFKIVIKAIPNGYDMGNILFVRSNIL